MAYKRYLLNKHKEINKKNMKFTYNFQIQCNY